MGLVFRLVLVEGGDSVVVARTNLMDRVAEALHDLMIYLDRWGALDESKEIRVEIMRGEPAEHDHVNGG
jgi:hypothetical protein